jgi:hypothetical protein
MKRNNKCSSRRLKVSQSVSQQSWCRCRQSDWTFRVGKGNVKGQRYYGWARGFQLFFTRAVLATNIGDGELEQSTRKMAKSNNHDFHLETLMSGHRVLTDWPLLPPPPSLHSTSRSRSIVETWIAHQLLLGFESR